MLNSKSIWTSISGSISSIIPLFFTVCKSGACTVACVSPIASILGISSASLMASPLTQSLFPLLIAISAVSFTISYYKLYVLPKYATASTCNTDCACAPPSKNKQYLFSLYTFWIGLLASIFFFTYFEYQQYQASTSLSTNQLSSESSACCAEGETCDTTNTEGVEQATLAASEEKPCCEGDKKCEK